MRNRPISTLALVAALVALTLLAFAIERAPALRAVRSVMQAREIDVSDHGVTKLHYALMHEGQLKLTYGRKRNGTVATLLTTSEAHENKPAPSTTIIDPELLRDGLTTVSLVTAEENLTDPKTGIVKNPRKKGRKWERPAFLSYFVNGELKFETPIGLRVHGGNSRGWPVKNFQVIFRRSYGAQTSPPGIFFDGTSAPYRRLVLSNTWRERRVGNFVAYEVAEAMGCVVSKTEPVRLMLNGQKMDVPFYAIEHQSHTFVENHFGRGDYLWHRLKGRNRYMTEYRQFRKWVGDKEIPKTMAEAGQLFDLDNLCAWIMAISYCDTDDSDQGGYFLDRRAAEPKWRCLTWDLDCSFMGRVCKRQILPFSDKPTGHRAHLFNGLLKDDPSFAPYFVRFATDALNHRVTPELVEAVMAKYRDIHARYGASAKNNYWLQEVGKFLRKRPAEFRALLTKHLEAGTFQPCSVTGISGPYWVDGYRKEAAYTGYYPLGGTMTVQLDASAPDISHWLVNGKVTKSEGRQLICEVTAPARIQAVFVDP